VLAVLMRIGDVTNKFGISHRSLHYWESVGILHSARGENDYRYYDEENMQKIKQIVVLRKLRLPIPSIQEIFTSNELSKVISVFTNHLDESKKEKEQLDALGVVLQQLIAMLKDRQNIESIYNYLDATHSTESGELKAALQTVLAGPAGEIKLTEPEQPAIDLTAVDLWLETMTKDDISDVTEVVRRCYPNTEDIDQLLSFFDFERQLNMPDCACYYKIMQSGGCVGVVNLAYTGMESMLIRNVAYTEPDNNIYIFELLKQKHPDILCWMMFDAGETANEYSYPDCEMKKRQFWEDNGFRFYTDANRRDQYVKMLKPHDEVYNSSRYRFAILDGSMDKVSFRMCALSGIDLYDNWMGGWRITDSAFVNAVIYNSGMEGSRFFRTTMTDCDFRYCNFENSAITNSTIKGLTIDGINVEKALEFYKMSTQA
jgi:DNA-binding transcriptional MerR regulator